MRDENDYIHHIKNIHYKPVKHGYVGKPMDWEYSRLRRYVQDGSYPEEWGNNVMEFIGIGNE